MLATNNSKLHQVQYECIKSELKDQYERRRLAISKKFTNKSAYDPSYRLLDVMTADEAFSASKDKN